MPADEIVDPADAHSDQVRRFLLHVGVPVLGVMLVVAVIGGIGLHSYRSIRSGALALTHDLLVSQQNYIAQEVGEYLSPASAGTVIARDMLEHGAQAAIQKIFNSYGGSMLRHVPQIHSFYLADADGHFNLIERDPAGHGLETTYLTGEGAGSQFAHQFFDAKSQPLRTESNPAAGYDPRTRPWYTGAAQSGKLYWSAPYLIAQTGQMIITASISYQGADGRNAVFAVNLSMNELTSFLDSLQIGKSGHALIVDQDGHLLAGRHMADVAKQAGGDPAKMTIDPTTYPVLAQAFDVYRVQGYGPHTIRNRKRDFISIAAPLPATAQKWVLLLVAPESDFANFALVDGRQNLMFSLLIVALAALLGALLFRQGRRSERLSQDLERQRAVSGHESQALQAVASYPGLFDPTDDALVLTRGLADQSSARRASVWRIMHDGATLLCVDSYDSHHDAHTGGFELSRTELSAFFDAVAHGDAFSVADAAQDSRTANFFRLFMRSFGSRGLFLAPVLGATGPVGVITLEDAPRAALVSHFTTMIAGMVAARFSAQHYSAVAAAAPELTGEPPDEEARHAFGDGFLVPPGSVAASAGGPSGGVAQPVSDGLFPAVAVMVITFSDLVTSPHADPAQVIALVETLATQLQAVAHQCGLYSIKMLGHRLVCVAGCSHTPDPGAVERMANAALAMREASLSILAKADLDPVFRMGIDVGPVFGGMLGRDPAVFNLWGDAIGMAEMMAQGAPEIGTIQVTQDVYQVLRQRFLFRERGRFFVPQAGMTRTYVLAGRR
ncbi:adenylate/guanylate cyclase [Gluconacetobacter diazotrophicus PA1 5]|uniref:Adenylate/guanylate cyclase domain-containing protein n=1 Tax=Gluconacetobacter diazotrophicus TaxID=33996 RepID=A0A7W4FEC0_GLUDI|nr:adenylate/guanylate cyclase domain-containing protein [Gluconacetobacter diazotrophicus]ACI53113.1 adenylate/guanylate cyclase [Gluconacetobacter diazotrophicus PA1 5]MBB2155954.1 adenylate/guanylate cyclase domain-containing protein [Gluconacetobacter diazotrophicus]TWB05611.1 adenylate/guanylate cyclase family protein [Gluconacetobacter diazotrophicus]